MTEFERLAPRLAKAHFQVRLLREAGDTARRLMAAYESGDREAVYVEQLILRALVEVLREEFGHEYFNPEVQFGEVKTVVEPETDRATFTQSLYLRMLTPKVFGPFGTPIHFGEI